MANGCFFDGDFFDPDFFDVCVPVTTDAGPPWKMRPIAEGLWFPNKVIVGQVEGLYERVEERAEIQLTSQIVAATLANRRAGVAASIEAQRAEQNRQLRRKQTALDNLARAQVKKEFGSLDPAEIIRLKNLQAKRLASLRKARQALKAKRKKK
jgi:hypothetical protein